VNQLPQKHQLGAASVGAALAAIDGSACRDMKVLMAGESAPEKCINIKTRDRQK
jgi:hypothetical protein